MALPIRHVDTPPLPTASLFAAQVAANTLLATSGSTAAADESREVDIAVGGPHLHLGLGQGLLLSFLRCLRDRRLNARSDSPLARATFNLCCGFELTAWACNWAAALLAEAWLLVFELGIVNVEVFGRSEMGKVLDSVCNFVVQSRKALMGWRSVEKNNLGETSIYVAAD